MSTILVREMAPQQQAVQVSLKVVTPSIQEGGPELAQLKEDLRRMRCIELLERQWGLKHKAIVRELIATERPNVFDGAIWDRPQM